MGDIGGQKTIREHWLQYFQCADALVYVVDSSDQNCLTESVDEFEKILAGIGMERNIPALIFANKQDLMHAVGADEIQDKLLDRVPTLNNYLVQACSALAEEDDGLTGG